MPIRLDGIDVAHYQYAASPIRWAQVAAIPTFWAATKLTQSVNYVDPTAARSRQSMTAVDFRQRGLYHWLSSTTDPTAQANWFVTCAGVFAVGEFAMCDAEEAGITVDGVLAWCETVEEFTHRPAVVYTGAFVAGGTIWTDPRVRMSNYGPRPMVLAAYTTEERARALPGLAANPWHAWQFGSNGPVDGVVGRCDMDRIDDIPAFDLACGYVAAGLPVTPPPAVIPPGSRAQEEDSMSNISNEEVLTQDFGDGKGSGPWQPGQAKWALVFDGVQITQLHLTEATYVPGVPEVMKSAELRAQIPVFAGWKGGGNTTVVNNTPPAPTAFHGTVELTAS